MDKKTLKKIIALLKKTGPVHKAKNGNGLIVYNPEDPDVDAIVKCCEKVGLKCIYNIESTTFDGKEVPPRIWVGNIKWI